MPRTAPRTARYRLSFLPSVSAETRAEVEREAASIRTVTRRAPKANHARARALLEAAGERAIASDDPSTVEKGARHWYARVYYTSEGGELLCFDSVTDEDLDWTRP